ncbi:hypothetical protein IAT38_003801 [Cryptococcus sp. DSM 104549]
MSSNDLILYGLVPKAHQSGPTVSPYVWKTKVGLAILGVKYTMDCKSFYEIRYELSKECGNPDVTVPTIKSGNEYITDSGVIADWLESKYGTPEKSLFGSPEGRAFARFVETWGNTVFGGELIRFIAVQTYSQLDERSSAYMRSKYGGGDDTGLKAAAVQMQAPEFVSALWGRLRKHLSLVESILAKNKAEGKKLFLTGQGPTHADANLFGWYALSRLHAGYAECWESPELPLVGEWVKSITELLGDEKLPSAPGKA